MSRSLRCGSLIVVLVLGLACGTEPTGPGPVPTPPSVPQPPPPTVPSGEPVATYVFSGPLDYPFRAPTSGSQYLLYDNGVFGLRYDAFAGVYLGTYQQNHDTISFWFGGNPGSIATGTLKGDLLEVRYSDMMQHSDFENAVYRRSR